ncbi:MAG: response regulator [Deltaproteobacteria bacterium]|nr:response regulator [Deltaproteobacteria bacterium]
MSSDSEPIQFNGDVLPRVLSVFEQRDREIVDIPKKQSIRILVADDEESVRTMLELALKDEGYQTDVAVDGADAVQKIAAQNFSVVVTDIRMPIKDGIEVLEMAKKVNSETEVIMMTGYASLETAKDAVRLGAYEYLIKPLPNIKELMKIVHRAVEKQLLANQNRQLMKALHKKVHELNVFYEISQSVNYLLDYQQLIHLMMTSLQKVIDCDVVASCVSEQDRAEIHVYLSRPASSEEMIDQIKEKVLISSKGSFGKSLAMKKIDVSVEVLKKSGEREIGPIQKLESFLDLPLVIQGQTMGVIHVASERANAFSEESAILLKTIANQMSESMGRLRNVIAEEKSRVDSMVASMTDGVIMTDEKGRVAVMNPVARAILGFLPDETIEARRLALRFEQLGAPEIRVREILPVDEEKGKEITLEVETKRYPQQVLGIHQAFVKNIQGKIIGLVTILRDITVRKEIERMKDEFIGTVSHELRTPLMIVKGAVSNLKDGIAGELTSKQIHVAETAYRNIDRLERIINDLLDLSRLESGRANLRRSNVNLRDLIEEVLRGFHVGGGDQKIELQSDLPKQLPSVYADPDLVIQVLNNLLSNALRFAKSRVRVRARSREDAPFVQIDVIDDGPGIEPEKKGFLFNKFIQLHRSQGGGGYKGTGLGLAICKEIVQLHEGQIGVENQVGKGARFYFTLPIYSEEIDFHARMEGILKEAPGEGLAFVAFSIQNFRELCEVGDEKEIEKSFQEVEERIQKQALRRGDQLLRYSPSVFVVFLGHITREGAQRVVERVTQIIQPSDFKPSDFKVEWEIAVYPEDGSTAAIFVQKMLKKWIS